MLLPSRSMWLPESVCKRTLARPGARATYGQHTGRRKRGVDRNPTGTRSTPFVSWRHRPSPSRKPFGARINTRRHMKTMPALNRTRHTELLFAISPRLVQLPPEKSSPHDHNREPRMPTPLPSALTGHQAPIIWLLASGPPGVMATLTASSIGSLKGTSIRSNPFS